MARARPVSPRARRCAPLTDGSRSVSRAAAQQVTVCTVKPSYRGGRREVTLGGAPVTRAVRAPADPEAPDAPV